MNSQVPTEVQTRFGGLKGRTAIVAGAAGGIGGAIASTLVSHGTRVLGIDYRWGPGTELTGAISFNCDISDEGSIDQAFRRAEEEFGPVDIVINSAGAFVEGGITDLPVSEWDRIMSINSRGTFLMFRRAIPHMRERRFGRLIHISSNAAKMGGVTSFPAYGASKAASDTLVRSLAVTEASYGITANSVAPALIDTPMLRSGSLADRAASMIPVGRVGHPFDVAYAALFFASDDASFITGEVLDVNGGFYID
jgi:3-oxoacyl-[acyl-carrier protein] reductase